MIEKEIANLSLEKRVFEHSMRVVNLCKKFTAKLNIADSNLIERAALLHDIGKKIDNENHHKESVIKKTLKKYNYAPTDINDIVYIIKHHKGKEFHPNHLEIECSILRICDKLDKFNKSKKDKQDIMNICDNNIKIIRSTLKNHPNELKCFEEIYNQLIDEAISQSPLQVSF